MVFRGQIGSQETDDRKNNRFFLIFWIKDDETQISIHEDIENGNVQLIWLFLFFFFRGKGSDSTKESEENHEAPGMSQ